VQPIRRSRGHAPLPLHLPVEVAPTIAVGGELKNAACVATGRHAWMTQHVGDLSTLETLTALEATLAGFSTMYDVTPELVACDTHPGYLSRRVAASLAVGDPVEVQHHHAHVAAVMAEHGLDGSTPVIGLAFDGTGHGLDGGAWGGEVLVADYGTARRVAHLAELPLPGGDAAVRNPCRLAVAYLTALGIEAEGVPSWDACGEVERRLIVRQIERSVGVVPTTSMGRLFDAVSSLLGLRHRITYEAQAAIELEIAATDAADAVPVRSPLHRDGVLDPAPVLRSLVDGVRAGAGTAELALGFHHAVVDGVGDVVAEVHDRTALDVVALSGGVFQNVLLTRLLRRRLEDDGRRVLTHRLVPPNDGGLALGQVLVAAHARS
ncbi:MAG: carbamoyltransferase HypF, partial [Actinomycetota bacterium]